MLPIGYTLLTGSDNTIREIANHNNTPYLKAYYCVEKQETISATEDILVIKVNITDDHAADDSTSFQHGQEARRFLGIPLQGKTTLNLGQIPSGYNVFVESTSHNRKIRPGQEIVLKTTTMDAGVEDDHASGETTNDRRRDAPDQDFNPRPSQRQTRQSEAASETTTAQHEDRVERQQQRRTKGASLPHRPHHILLGVTGSVATVKAPQIAVELVRNLNARVKILLTAGARNFWEPGAQEYNEKWWTKLQAEVKDQKRIEILFSEDEWRSWNRLGDPVMHIELRDWADCFVFAPLSAHTLAKLANGLCDDALSSVARAWDFGDGRISHTPKPMVLAPAMNTYMWDHPLTQRQLSAIQDFFSSATSNPQSAVTHRSCPIVQPQSKTLACGQVGNGALAPVSAIIDSVRRVLETNVAKTT